MRCRRTEWEVVCDRVARASQSVSLILFAPEHGQHFLVIHLQCKDSGRQSVEDEPRLTPSAAGGCFEVVTKWSPSTLLSCSVLRDEVRSRSHNDVCGDKCGARAWQCEWLKRQTSAPRSHVRCSRNILVYALVTDCISCHQLIAADCAGHFGESSRNNKQTGWLGCRIETVYEATHNAMER